MTRILIVTPLYPPDIAPSAVYIKEFAQRFSSRAEVTILAYAHIPEKITGVRIVTIPKNKPLLVRLFNFTWALLRESRNADVLYIQNGVSVELPVNIVSLFIHTPRIVQLSDRPAYTTSITRPFHRNILRFILSHATHIIHTQNAELPFSHPLKTTIISMPLLRPEIFPLESYPTEAFTLYEKSWHDHTEDVMRVLNKYGK